jgi:hypothetical protein
LLEQNNFHEAPLERRNWQYAAREQENWKDAAREQESWNVAPLDRYNQMSRQTFVEIIECRPQDA